jgi:hypothetical protein
MSTRNALVVDSSFAGKVGGMKNVHGRLAVCGLWLALVSGTQVGTAQVVPTVPIATWDDFSSPGYQSQLDPAWGVSPTGDGPPIVPASRMYGGVDLGVPLMLDVDHDLIRPGVNLHLQGGVDLGYAAFFLHGGWRWIPVDFDRAADSKHPEYEGQGRDPLRNPYFGLGVRGQIPNRSRVMPYASVSFDFNFWNFHETELACGGYYYWWCADYDVYRFTPGFSGRLGLAVHIMQGVYFDFGMGASMSFAGDFFDQNQSWIEPFAGVLMRR